MRVHQFRPLGLFERLSAASSRRLVLVAPSPALVPPLFRKASTDGWLHEHLIREVQRLRGRVYVEEGAVRPEELTPDGRHWTPEDDRAWHLLLMDGPRLTACMWYLNHEFAGSVDDLRVRDCPLATNHEFAERFRYAVGREIASARRQHLQYVELGGWAVRTENRHTGEGLLLALAAYGLGRTFGGAIGLTTATVRHASAAILRRLGGVSLEAEEGPFPSYFDPRYGCQMEVLGFDSRRPNPKYERAIDMLAEQLRGTPVVRTPWVLPTSAIPRRLMALEANGGTAA